MNSRLYRLFKYSWKNILAIEIMLLISYFMLIHFVFPLLKGYENTYQVLTGADIDKLYLVEDSRQQPIKDDYELFLANDDFKVVINGNIAKCRIFLVPSETKHIYLCNNFVIPEDDECELDISIGKFIERVPYTVINHLVNLLGDPFLPVVIITGFNEYINTYNLLSIRWNTVDLSSCVLIDTIITASIKNLVLDLLILWFCLYFVLSIFVRFCCPFGCGTRTITLYSLLRTYGIKRSNMIFDSLVFVVFTNLLFILVLLLQGSFVGKRFILLFLLVQHIIIPFLVESIIINKGCRQ